MKFKLLILSLFISAVSFGQCDSVPAANITINNVTATGFKVNWTAATGAVSYSIDVEDTITGGLVTYTTTGLFYNVSGLASNRVYGVKVVTNCSGGVTAQHVYPVNQRTLSTVSGYTYTKYNVYGWEVPRLKVLNDFSLPIKDTISTTTYQDSGQVVIRRADSSLWYRMKGKFMQVATVDLVDSAAATQSVMEAYRISDGTEGSDIDLATEFLDKDSTAVNLTGKRIIQVIRKPDILKRQTAGDPAIDAYVLTSSELKLGSPLSAGEMVFVLYSSNFVGDSSYTAGYGLNLSSNVFSVDSFLLSTRAWRQKGIDSVVSLLASYAPITGGSGYIQNQKSTSQSASYKISGTGSQGWLEITGYGDTTTGAGGNSGIVINRELNPFSYSARGVKDFTTHFGNSGGVTPGYASFDAAPQMFNTNGYSYDHVMAFEARPVFQSSGSINNMYSFWSELSPKTGTATNVYDFYASNFAATGSPGTVGTHYGMYISDFEGASYKATNNYGVYTAGTTPSVFGGAVTVGSIIKSGGTSSQFLKADGSVDASTYLTTTTAASSYVALTGAQTIAGAKTFSGNIWQGTASTYQIETVQASSSATIAAQSGLSTGQASFFAQHTGTGGYIQGVTYGATATGTFFGLNRTSSTFMLVTSTTAAAIGNVANAPLIFGVNNTEKWRINTAGTLVGNATGITLGSMADASAPNSTLYYSTTQSKLVWKDASGVVNVLY